MKRVWREANGETNLISSSPASQSQLDLEMSGDFRTSVSRTEEVISLVASMKKTQSKKLESINALFVVISKQKNLILKII